VNRQKPGRLEERTAPDVLTAEDRKIRGVVPYGVESRDMGGWPEVIDRGALDRTRFDDLVVTVDHVGVPLGRFPTTLELEDRDDGMHWSVTPPASRADVREAVERGDLRAGSFRMVVARDEWRGDVRHIKAIAELRDVSIVTAPAYPAAAVEYRSHNPAEAEEDTVRDTAHPAVEPDTATAVEDRARPTGGLNVEDRVSVTRERPRGLAEEFRAAGFPGDLATVPFEAFEDRAVTWTGSVDLIQKARSTATDLGMDQRYAWPGFQRVNVDEGVTSVDVFTQTARSLATAANVVRAVDATTNKPETGSTVTLVTTSMKQVATVQSGIPNVYLESAAFNTIIENDLRLALNEGLDKLVLDAIAGAGFQAPGTDPLLVSIRKAITTLQGNGYNPDTLILTPANAEALDVLVSGLSGGTKDYVFGAGGFAPGTIFGLNKRISKTIPAAAVVDSNALGKMYASRVSLARFEENAGKTNTSLVRLETHAVFGTERQNAAVRIAAS
jgi:HK97 family phage prohead protease